MSLEKNIPEFKTIVPLCCRCQRGSSLKFDKANPARELLQCDYYGGEPPRELARGKTQVCPYFQELIRS